MTRPIIHPGEILVEEFLKPAGVSPVTLAEELKLPPEHIDAIVGGRRSVCVDTALRLSRYFGTSDRFWLEAQLAYDLEQARRGKQAAIKSEVRPFGA